MIIPRGRRIYLNKIPETVDFSKDWNFHYRLDQNQETRQDLKTSMEDFEIVRDSDGRLPFIQVRPNVQLYSNNSRIEVLYNSSSVIGYLPQAIHGQWIEIMSLMKELSQSPFIKKPLNIKTRAAIFKVSSNWEVHISLRDPVSTQEILLSKLKRLRKEEEIRAQCSSEQWEEYLDSRYKYFEMKYT